MAIKGIIYDNQSPTAKGLRGGFHAALTDGILEGCTISKSDFNLNISAGLMHVAGGIFAITAGQTVALTYDPSKTYGRIKAVMNLSGTSSASVFNQVSFEIDYATASNTFTNLVQGNVNYGSDTIYEAEIAVVQLNSSGISKIVRIAKASSKIQYGDTLPEDAPEGTVFLLKVT